MNRETILNAYGKVQHQLGQMFIGVWAVDDKRAVYPKWGRRKRQLRKFRARLLRKCEWTWEYDGGLDSSFGGCSKAARAPMNPAEDFGWTFCPYCGGELEVEE